MSPIASHVDARIETEKDKISPYMRAIAPHAGARIETELTRPLLLVTHIASLADARIETQRGITPQKTTRLDSKSNLVVLYFLSTLIKLSHYQQIFQLLIHHPQTALMRTHRIHSPQRTLASRHPLFCAPRCCCEP